MHHSGPLSKTLERSEQGFGGKNCQNASQGTQHCILFLATDKRGYQENTFIIVFDLITILCV